MFFGIATGPCGAATSAAKTPANSSNLTMDSLLKLAETLPKVENPFQSLALKHGFDLDAGDMMLVPKKLIDEIPDLRNWQHPNVHVTDMVNQLLCWKKERPPVNERLLAQLAPMFMPKAKPNFPAT